MSLESRVRSVSLLGGADADRSSEKQPALQIYQCFVIIKTEMYVVIGGHSM